MSPVPLMERGRITSGVSGIDCVAGLIGAFWLLVFSGMLAVSSLVAIWVGGCMAFGRVWQVWQ